MKTPDQMGALDGQKLAKSIALWLSDTDPVENKGKFLIKFGIHRDPIRAFVEQERKAEIAEQLSVFHWKVVSFEYEHVEVAPL